jgi:ribose/xylose/arabinose/galactoside ABC-type transport system permease subunit
VNRTRLLTRETMLVAMMIVLVVVNSALFPTIFPTIGNLTAILRSLAFDGIMVCGMMLLLVGGTFDLSIGGTFSMAGVVAGWLMKNGEVPVFWAVLLGLLVAVAAGLINGLIVARVRVNALIATLGTMGIYRGIAVLLGGPGITFLPESFSRPGQAVILGLQGPVWMMIAIAILFSFLLSRTRYFRQFYYIGNNATAARLSGIDVPQMQIAGFVIMGFLAGFSGIAFASRVGTSVSISGDGAELRIITAAILGGASLTGGKGTIWGALIGVGFIALINNALIIASVSAYWQSIITGIVLVAAVAMDRFMKKD